MKTFDVAGRVIDKTSGGPVPDLRVEAWDRDERFHSLLGVEHTDADGRFSIRFDENAYGDFGSDVLPDVYFKVLAGEQVLADTFATPEVDRAAGRSERVLTVDTAALPAPMPPAPEPDLTVSEVGESLAATVASIQQELAHYPMALGTFVVDDLEVDIPVRYRVDGLGQLRVRIGGATAAESGGSLRLRVKPVLEPPEPRSVTAPQPLTALDALSDDALSRLEAHRVYSVDDLLRVSRNAAGRRALEALGVPDVDGLVGRAEVIALPTVPATVTTELVKLGIDQPKAFVEADPSRLAKKLNQGLADDVDAGDVTAWQELTRPLVALPRPGEKEAIDA